MLVTLMPLFMSLEGRSWSSVVGARAHTHCSHDKSPDGRSVSVSQPHQCALLPTGACTIFKCTHTHTRPGRLVNYLLVRRGDLTDEANIDSGHVATCPDAMAHCTVQVHQLPSTCQWPYQSSVSAQLNIPCLTDRHGIGGAAIVLGIDPTRARRRDAPLRRRSIFRERHTHFFPLFKGSLVGFGFRMSEKGQGCCNWQMRKHSTHRRHRRTKTDATFCPPSIWCGYWQGDSSFSLSLSLSVQ